MATRTPISKILSRWLIVTKDFLDLFQKIGLVLLFIIVLFDHRSVTEWSNKTPLKSFFGVEVKDKEERENLLASEQERSKEISAVIEKLKEIESNIPQEDVTKIQTSIDTLKDTKSAISETIKSIDQNIQISETVPATKIPATDNKWLVVFGADKTISAAQDEIDRANKRNYDNAIILKRDGWYRSVITFDNESEAQNKLRNIQNELREGSYIRDLNTWCPDWKPEVKTDGEHKYHQCKL